MALGDFEAYAVPLGERFEAFALNFRKMDENVGPIVLLNETETFCVVEPLHGTFCHFDLHVLFARTFLVVQITVAQK